MPTSIDPVFDAYAENYDDALNRGLAFSGESKDYFARGRMRWLARRLRELSFWPRTALDYGCGTGTSAPLLLGLEGLESVTGVDVSEGSIAVARRLYGSEHARFSLLSELPCDESFELAFCNGVFHHIPIVERAPAVKTVFRSLRPGGFFALWENNPWNLGTRLVMSRVPFDRDAVPLAPPETKRLLSSGGFEWVGVDYLFFFPRALAWLRWLEPALRKLPLGAQYLMLARKPA